MSDKAGRRRVPQIVYLEGAVTDPCRLPEWHIKGPVYKGRIEVATTHWIVMGATYSSNKSWYDVLFSDAPHYISAILLGVSVHSGYVPVPPGGGAEVVLLVIEHPG
jgi:hypothetical protein